MTPEQITAIIVALGLGGILKAVVDAVITGHRESRKARGLDPSRLARAEAQAAFYAEALQATRELYLTSGGDPAALGPVPRWTPTTSPDPEE